MTDSRCPSDHPSSRSSPSSSSHDSNPTFASNSSSTYRVGSSIARPITSQYFAPMSQYPRTAPESSIMNDESITSLARQSLRLSLSPHPSRPTPLAPMTTTNQTTIPPQPRASGCAPPRTDPTATSRPSRPIPITPKSIYSIHAPPGYFPSLPPTTSSRPHPRSSPAGPPPQVTSSSPSSSAIATQGVSCPSRQHSPALGRRSGSERSQNVYDLLSDDPPPPTSSTEEKLQLSLGGGVGNSSMTVCSPSRGESPFTGDLIDFEEVVSPREEHDGDVSSSKSSLERHDNEDRDRSVSVRVHSTRSTTVEELRTQLDEAVQEIISLEAELESNQSKHETEVYELKREWEERLEKERKGSERMRIEIETLRDKLRQLESEEKATRTSSPSSGEGFVYDLVEARSGRDRERDTRRLEEVTRRITDPGFERKRDDSELDIVKVRTRDEMLDLSHSPIAFKLTVNFPEGILPHQIDARRLRRVESQASLTLGQREPHVSPARREFKDETTSPFEQIDRLMAVNAQLDEEMRQAQGTIEGLMRAGGDSRGTVGDFRRKRGLTKRRNGGRK